MFIKIFTKLHPLREELLKMTIKYMCLFGRLRSARVEAETEFSDSSISRDKDFVVPLA